MNSSAQFHLNDSLLLRRISAILALFVLLSAAALADTIKLKNGSIIKGRVVGYSQGEFTVILDLGASTRRTSTRMIIAAEDIESIEFEGREGTSSAGSQSESSGLAAPSRPPAGTQRDTAPSTPVRSGSDTSIAPQRNTEPETETPPPATPSGSSAPSGATIAEKEVRVVASVDWTNTSLRIQKGQRITITSSGEVDLGKGRRSGPGGIDQPDPGKLLEDRQTGAMIAVIGDDNNDFIFVGRQTEFTAAHSGFLYLSVNERDLKDNSGSYIARVRISGSK